MNHSLIKKEFDMSAILSSLKLVTAKRQSQNDPTESRRLKLSNKLKEQLALATALKNNETYVCKRLRSVTDSEGVRQTIEVSKKVRQWWFVQNNKVCVQIRYGSKVVALSAKGDKNSVEVSNADELIDVLKKLEHAVTSGELDSQIEVASEGVRARFKK
jgi:ribonuclease HI